jgi:hypothetical protein
MTTEMVGGVQLSTYGLRLSYIEGHLDLPARKQIVEEHDYCDAMKVYEERKIKIRLIGKYTSSADLGNKIELFKTKIRSAVKLVWQFTNHGFNQTCVVANGMDVTVYSRRYVEINLTLTVTI